MRKLQNLIVRPSLRLLKLVAERTTEWRVAGRHSYVYNPRSKAAAACCPSSATRAANEIRKNAHIFTFIENIQHNLASLSSDKEYTCMFHGTPAGGFVRHR